MKVSKMLSWIGLSSRRPSVLIFGASSSGASQLQKIRRSHKVVGFVDNSPGKQGSRFKNKPIYSPHDIPRLCYDKIIIASCYYQEIARQLVDEIEVKSEKISVFHHDGKPGFQILSRYVGYLSNLYFRAILNTRRPLLAKIGYMILQYASATYRSATLRPIYWLDEEKSELDVVLEPESKVDIFGPRFIGENQPRHSVSLPAVRLLRHQNAMMCCTTNSILCNGKLLMWRSPTSGNRYSDYSSAFIAMHGQNFALTESFGVTEIAKGIAIGGSADINYYHWVLEVLSKLAYLKDLDEEYSDYPVLISEKAREIEAIATFVEELDLRKEIIYLQSGGYYQIADSLMITPPNFTVANFSGKTRHTVSDSYFTCSTLQFIRRTGLSCAARHKIHAPSSERIFLARKGVFRPYNQDAVWKILESEGFTRVYLEDLLFVEQVHVMQHARLIVGPTGSAWTNLLFCNSGARALCWMAEEYGNFSCYSHIAFAMGVELEYLSYETGSTSSRELFYGAYSVDLSKISRWLVDNQLS